VQGKKGRERDSERGRWKIDGGGEGERNKETRLANRREAKQLAYSSNINKLHHRLVLLIYNMLAHLPHSKQVEHKLKHCPTNSIINRIGN